MYAEGMWVAELGVEKIVCSDDGNNDRGDRIAASSAKVSDTTAE